MHSYLKTIISKRYSVKLQDLFKHYNTQEYLTLYLNTVNWSRDQVISYQTTQLKELLYYSYKNVKFYKKRFDDAGFNVENFKYLDQLKGIPPLTRHDLQNYNKSILSQEKENYLLTKGSSSGSTGEPVIYYHDQFGNSANKAAILFGKILGGYKLGDPWTNVWGNPTAVNREWKKLSSRVSKYLFNETRFPAFSLQSEEQFRKLINSILDHKSTFIYGYTNAIYLLSKFVYENNISLNRIRGVFTTAENLHDYQRKSIENSVGKIFDQYGSSEIPGVASETTYDKFYSVIDPHVIVEFDKFSNNENILESQKIIITDLHNKVFPFIRYENGDLAEPFLEKETSSKLKYSKLSKIDGRVSDIISLPGGGSLVVPSFFGSRMLKNINGIIQYQVILKQKCTLEINLITDINFKNDSKTTIENTLKEYLPTNLFYNLVFNKPIIKSKNGKIKLLIDNS